MLTIPPKQCIIPNMLTKLRSRRITSKVGSFKGAIIEGAGGCEKGRCVCAWVQWDKFLAFPFVPDLPTSSCCVCDIGTTVGVYLGPVLRAQECLGEPRYIQAVWQLDAVLDTILVIDVKTESACTFGNQPAGDSKNGSSLRRLEVSEAFLSS